MWSRESIGAGSVEGVEGVGASNALRPTDTNSHWNRHHHHHHHQVPRRFDSTELADSPIRNEALKLVRELSKAVAGHVALATLLGGSGDGPHLRDELRRARRTAQEAAASAKSTLLPTLLDQQKSGGEKERTELERLWYLLLCCLDALEMSMHRCLTLLREFSLADGNNVVIHTGIECPSHLMNRQAVSTTAAQEKENNIELQFRDKLSLEGVEASQLCKELFELRAQLQELKTAVELRSISMPELEEITDRPKGGPLRTDTLISINGTDGMVQSCGSGGGGGGLLSDECSVLCSEDKESVESDPSQCSGITNTQSHCVCIVLFVMCSLVVLLLFLGVFIAIFS